MVDIGMRLFVVAVAAAAIYWVVHEFYGVLNPTILQDALAGAVMLGLAYAASYLSRKKNRS